MRIKFAVINWLLGMIDGMGIDELLHTNKREERNTKGSAAPTQ